MSTKSVHTKEETFLQAVCLTGALEEVPGLGDVGIKNLRAKGINTTYRAFAIIFLSPHFT